MAKPYGSRRKIQLLIQAASARGRTTYPSGPVGRTSARMLDLITLLNQTLSDHGSPRFMLL